MKISFENPDKLNGLLTIVVEEADYKEEVEKALKDYRKRANIPGCLLYTSPSPRDRSLSRMPSSA